MASSFGSILVVGGGGREHAIAWKLSQSKKLTKEDTIFVAPGNGGTALMQAECQIKNINLATVDEMVNFSKENKIKLVVVGPEQPLAEGLADKLADAKIPCFGPSQKAAEIEGSKAFSKYFMNKYNIPTSAFEVFEDFEAAQKFIKETDMKVVVKASGLAAGKGVIVPRDKEEAIRACKDMLVGKKFGDAGQKVVVEEFIEGVEASILAFCDGKTVVPMRPARDHKRIFAFNEGPNTGGMGAFAPCKEVDDEFMAEIVKTVLQPACDGMRAEGRPYVGVLYAGLMLSNNQKPYVLEFNARFGDPETQVVLPLLKSDLLDVFLACVEGRLSEFKVEWHMDKFAATVCAVSEGYPESYPKGRVITGHDKAAKLPNTVVFHAGTKLQDGKELVTSGGRVFAVSGIGSSMEEALGYAYDGVEQIKFQGVFYRKDIGGYWRYTRSEGKERKLRLAVLGSTNGTDMVAVIDAIKSGRLNASIEVVISNLEKAGILEKARTAGIPALAISAKGKTREEFDAIVVKELLARDVDLILLIGYMRIVSGVFVDAFTWRILNVHPSLLPEFAGGMDKSVHEAVIAAGRKETGCTIHFVDRGVDSGAILAQKRCSIDEKETPDSLKAKVQKLEGEAFVEVIERFQPEKRFLQQILTHNGFPFKNKVLARRYRQPALSVAQANRLVQDANTLFKGSVLESIDSEYLYYIDFQESNVTKDEEITLNWLLGETFEPQNLAQKSFLDTRGDSVIVEVGPRNNFVSAWSSNAVAICQRCGLKINRMEQFRRYHLRTSRKLSAAEIQQFANLVHDRMTEYQVTDPRGVLTFETGRQPEGWHVVPVLEKGKDILQHYNKEMGLALDDWDIDYYFNLFTQKLKRNPTTVELFDISQSNSEHSRHWFFRGRLVVDGKEAPEHLMQVVKSTLKANPDKSVVAFSDNSSAIEGFPCKTLIPDYSRGVGPSPLVPQQRNRHLLLTAETHNFPSAVAPFPGAETGTGGRIRDTHATGKGSLVATGIVGYSVGNLNIPGYTLPWEDKSFAYPKNLASPLEIEVLASDGASDYGNKFGEPVISGFTRSFGLRLPNGERREWVKPIMFSAGIGFIEAEHCQKGEPEKGMLIVKVGGPAYRIGMGGSAASSMTQGANKESLDFNAVQRGDAEMEQKLNRAIRACVELGDKNPIISIHDQGAGGNCNVLKEIAHPAGARIELRKIISGDATLSVLELWGAEYQEANALLIKASDQKLFEEICDRERCPVAFVGSVTGDGRVVLWDSHDNKTPVDMDLEDILGSMPQKVFKLTRNPSLTQHVSLPASLTVESALDRVLRLLSVGSKRFLTSKVDRCVTGLVAQQQCVGPLHLPLADVCVTASSHFNTTGIASAVGEQPIKGFLNPEAMARLTVGEALTNLVFAPVTSIHHVKCSGNWMWAPKLPGEGAPMYDCAIAMRDVMIAVGIAVDGGKDSLSMAARCPTGHDSKDQELVKAPGTLVVTVYGPCPDITATINPAIKSPGQSTLILVKLSGSTLSRLGGSALAQVYEQVGAKEDCPDMNDPALFKKGFNTIQKLISARKVLSGHDISDGGLIVTVLEMAFGGNCGLDLNIPIPKGQKSLDYLFAEELGVVLEVANSELKSVVDELKGQGLPVSVLGSTTSDLGKSARIVIKAGQDAILDRPTAELRDIWEATSFELEKKQRNPECVLAEQKGLKDRVAPALKLTYAPALTSDEIINAKNKPKVAVLREEGSNGDREMSSAFFAAGFEVWDITMSDLVNNKISLDDFRGLVCVGGFSYADVLGSAKGWAGVIRFNSNVLSQFNRFYNRPDTFSLGVCNGCQLLALLGWVPFKPPATQKENLEQPRFIHNVSGRFESRFSTVTVEESPAIMFKGMAGSTLGVWVAHGEGRAYFPNPAHLQQVESAHQVPLRYADDSGAPTDRYPFCPNGSTNGIASLCSLDGRHLAMMPHPERCYIKWQWPWMPNEWASIKASPWLRLFQNAFEWCQKTAISIAPSPVYHILLNIQHGDKKATLKVRQSDRKAIEMAVRSRFQLDSRALIEVEDAKGVRSPLSHQLSSGSYALVVNGATLEKKTRDRRYRIEAEEKFYRQKIAAQLNLALQKTDFQSSLASLKPEFRKGKVRDSYECITQENKKVIVLVTTDRQSAFDRILAAVPFKGQVLNLVSKFWFDKTKHIIPNHILAVPDGNVTVGKVCQPFPVEFVARAYITGTTSTSLWTHYAKGSRFYCGNKLPEGLRKNQKLEKVLLTPTTKSDEHDRPISPEEIVREGLMTQAEWDYCAEKVLAIFAVGAEWAAKHNLLLVDTKFELGKDENGVIHIIDEALTPDSSRYWIADTYQERFLNNQEPENIDKEFLRLWFVANCDPYKDAVLPRAPDELIIELSRRYISMYEMITGEDFPFPKENEPVEERIKKNLVKYFKL